MYSLTVENKYGERLELTHNDSYGISNIDGFDPPDATINTTRNAGQDGSTYNSAYVLERTITITMAVNWPAEQNRIQLYRYFKSKQWVKLYYSNGSRNVFTEGYVQSIQVAYFERKETVQIVVKCPKPYLEINGANVQSFDSITAEFEFPFSIQEEGQVFSSIELVEEAVVTNAGDVETGMIITIKALGELVNPKIFNSETREYIAIEYTFAEGDVITINTIKGQKSASVLSGGETISLIGHLLHGFTWLQLQPKDNLFTLAADSGQEYMSVTFDVTDLFEGV